LLSEFLMTYRIYRQYHIRQSLQSHMINEVIRPGPINPRDTCCVNTFIQLPFHILPLILLIVAWLNRDLTLSSLHLMVIAISQDWLINAILLSTVCEPDVFAGKNYSELGLQRLGSLCDGSSGTLRNTIQQLFCSRQIVRFSPSFSSIGVSDRHSSDTFPFQDPLLGSNA
jgi:hypothetical protein